MPLPQNSSCSHHCFLPLPFLDGCASVCSFPVTSDRSTAKSDEDLHQLSNLVNRAPKQSRDDPNLHLAISTASTSHLDLPSNLNVLSKCATLLSALHSHTLSQRPESLACFSIAVPVTPMINNIGISVVPFTERHSVLYNVYK